MPRPTISGTVIRQIDMNHSSPGKHKDYRITIAQESDDRCRIYTEYGPAGRLQNGKEQTTNPISLGRAAGMAADIRDRKLLQADSYRVVSDQRFSAPTAPTPSAAPKLTTAPARKLVTAESLSPASRTRLAALL